MAINYLLNVSKDIVYDTRILTLCCVFNYIGDHMINVITDVEYLGVQWDCLLEQIKVKVIRALGIEHSSHLGVGVVGVVRVSESGLIKNTIKFLPPSINI